MRARQADIAGYALARLELTSAAALCPTAPVAHLIEQHGDGAYAVLRFVADCPDRVAELGVAYGLLLDLDALHRGLVRVDADGVTQTAVLGPGHRRWRVTPEQPDLWQQFVSYLGEGIWHIWSGLGHILFLISLLLPTVLRRTPDDWNPIGRCRYGPLGLVKAFTLAHSVTLSLAAFGLVILPARLVESAIAASIVLAALNNLHPIFTGRLWLVAFSFGLVHGFGFASVLADLGLPRDALLLPLFSFNLGGGRATDGRRPAHAVRLCAPPELA